MIIIIDLNQEVVVRWSSYTKQHYIDLGYTFTGINQEFLVKAKDLHRRSSVVVDVVCDFCNKPYKKKYGEYNDVIENNDGKYICKSCTTKRNNDKRLGPNYKNIIYDKFLEYCRKHNYIPISKMDCYENAKSKFEYMCMKHGIKTITIDGIKADTQCNCCSFEHLSEINRRDIDEVIQIVESNGNILLNPLDYINTETSNLRVVCGLCGDEFTTSLASQIATKGHCVNCGIKDNAMQLTLKPDEIDLRYNSVETKLLNPEDYMRSNYKNLIFLCSECGTPFCTSSASYSSGHTRCLNCRNHKSEGEYKIFQFLNSHNIQNIPLKWWPDCRDIKPLPFDFYLPDYNMVIEFDGIYHYYPIHGEERYKKCVLHDLMKNKYCNDNNIQIVRIPYWEFRNIENILIKELKL